MDHLAFDVFKVVLDVADLACVECLAEPDVDVVLEEVGVALDALRHRGGGRSGEGVVEQAVEVHVVHALEMKQIIILFFFNASIAF